MENIIDENKHEFLTDISNMLKNNKNIINWFFYSFNNEIYLKFKDIKNNTKSIKVDNLFCEKYIKAMKGLKTC